MVPPHPSLRVAPPQVTGGLPQATAFVRGRQQALLKHVALTPSVLVPVQGSLQVTSPPQLSDS
jgi:hypothetical protein